MKAVIRLDVPDWQIGQPVTVYFKDTMQKNGVCEADDIVRCKDCKWWDKKAGSPYGYCHACKHGHRSEHWEIDIYRTYKGNWFCADGEKRTD